MDGLLRRFAPRNDTGLNRIRRHKAADDDAAAVMHVPHHGFAVRVALIANDRAFGHLDPLALDRTPIGATANVVGSAMSVRRIAAGHGVSRAPALQRGGG